MNALFDALVGDKGPPIHVTVEGGLYLVLTDFRHWMRVESTLLDTTMPDEHKGQLLLSAFLPAIAAGQIDPRQGYPFEADAAMAALQAFYDCERTQEGAGKAKAPKSRKQERAYDFIHDIGLIYAAFREAYGMDLARENDLHWWVFRALFDGLPEGSMLRCVMQVRSQCPEKPTKAQREAKEAVALPENLRYFAQSARGKNYGSWVEQMKARKARASS